MPQFFVSGKSIRGKSFSFDESESFHLIKVLRKSEGDSIRIFDGEGSVYDAKIMDCSNPASVKGEILETLSDQKFKQQSSSISEKVIVNIFPSLLKGPRFEWMLEKAAELGIVSIHPIWTERTLIQIDPKKIKSKLERWEKILLASSKQCGRDTLPKIFEPVSFKEALSLISPDECSLILWEREEKNKLSDLVHEKKSVSDFDRSPIKFNLLFGPEGGLTLKEMESAQQSGLLPVTLGKNVLRAETAVTVASALVLA